ncbi:MAG: AcvB/VirJ family lysyl-phosphatidylglycerol hydrolase, partial [Ginsengibacter sp.]
MKKIILFIISSIPFFCISAFADDFPVKEWEAASHDKPLIFYLSGDGGFNKFSTALCEGFNKKGFDVISLNSKSYFWDKKTPEQTTTDISNFLIKKLAGRKSQQIVFIGYSFGADVLPFVLNRLPKEINDKILVSFLMASSGSTDFEIHWADIFGGNSKRDMDVVTEVNKLVDDKIVI